MTEHRNKTLLALQVSQAGRTQLLKHGGGAGGTTGAAVVSVTTSGAAGASVVHTPKTRTVSEAEMNAMIRRQQQQGKAGQITQVTPLSLSRFIPYITHAYLLYGMFTCCLVISSSSSDCSSADSMNSIYNGNYRNISNTSSMY